MAGGNWITQNKVLPGVYTNYIGRGNNPQIGGDRGVVALPMTFPWLKEQIMLPVYPGDIAKLNAATMVGEAMKNATVVYLYRMNRGVKASADIGGLTCSARYSGSYGNRFSVSVENVVAHDGKFEVVTWFDVDEIDRQRVTSIAELISNDWINFSPKADNSIFTINAGTQLSNGTDGNVTNGDWVSFLSAAELVELNAIACPTEDVDIKNLFATFAKRMIQENGKYLQAVVADSSSINHEGVISVKNGVILENGTHISNVEATAYVAGATAGCPLDKSLTNSEYIGAIDVDKRYTIPEQTELAQTGHIIFIPAASTNNKVFLQKDINTLHSFTKDKTYAMSKNKIIRILFDIAGNIHKLANLYYIGKVQNNEDGRDLYRKEILAYFRNLEGRGILNRVFVDDIQVLPGELVDAVKVNYIIRPADVMEIFYNTIVVEG